MKTYATVSAKVSQRERDELKKLGLKPTEIIRRAVQEEIRRAKNKELMKKMRRVAPIVKKLNVDEIVSDIRKDRQR